jgi:hypothetical protein
MAVVVVFPFARQDSRRARHPGVDGTGIDFTTLSGKSRAAPAALRRRPEREASSRPGPLSDAPGGEEELLWALANVKTL